MSIFLILIYGNYDEEFRFVLSKTLGYLALYQVWWTEWIMFHCVTDFVIHSLLFPEIMVLNVYFSVPQTLTPLFSYKRSPLFTNVDSSTEQSRFYLSLYLYSAQSLWLSQAFCASPHYIHLDSVQNASFRMIFHLCNCIFPISSSVQINFNIFLNYLVTGNVGDSHLVCSQQPYFIRLGDRKDKKKST